MLVFKIVDGNKKPVKKAKVTVHIHEGGNASALTDRSGFVAVPVTGGTFGTVTVNGNQVYDGNVRELDELVLP
ncbi:MAG TPA: hypothetical protein DCZ03_12635 [Gammaproteobacteria bacterium]|nr:hypothetical protein [Gammaproteobacteria bacterium]